MTRTSSKLDLVGLVVEGQTEYTALPNLVQRFGVRCTKPSVFDGQPADATVAAFVEHRLLKHARTQLRKNPTRVIVVVDREARSQTARAFAVELQAELRRQIRSSESEAAARTVFAVVADRRFENWLLTDPEGVSKSALFSKRSGIVGKVSCHADDREAKSLLQSAMKRKWYERAVHGPQLAPHIRVKLPAHAYCSRSFEDFLKLLAPLTGIAGPR